MIIKPIYNGTRLREDHTTFANVIETYDANSTVEGDLIWTAPANGEQVYAGDKWLHCTKINSVPVNGWMTIIHLGKTYCIIVDESELPPPETVAVLKILSAEVDVKWLGADGKEYHTIQSMIPDENPPA